MAGKARTRTIGPTYKSGSFTRQYTSDKVVKTLNDRVLVQTCIDTINDYGNDHGFELTREQVVGGVLNGTRLWTVPWELDTWNNLPVNLWTTSGPATFGPTLSDNNAKLAAINATSPSRDHVSLPAFIGELKDLPRMIRQAGRLLLAPKEIVDRAKRYINNPNSKTGIGTYVLDKQLSAGKRAASFHLAMEFGWKPLLSDLTKLIDFQAAVEKRRKEIDRLYSKRGLKRRITLEDRKYSGIVNGHLYFSEAGTVLQSGANIHHERSIKRWATVRWRPLKSSPLPPTDQQLMSAMYGLDVHGLTYAVWELLPWSWLIDYFTNVGDVLKASDNSLGATVESCCVMTHTKQEIRHPPAYWSFGTAGSVTFSGGVYTNEKKLRVIGLPSLSLNAEIPLLTGSQLSILASVAMLKSPRRG